MSPAACAPCNPTGRGSGPPVVEADGAVREADGAADLDLEAVGQLVRPAGIRHS